MYLYKAVIIFFTVFEQFYLILQILCILIFRNYFLNIRILKKINLIFISFVFSNITKIKVE